MVIGQLRLGGDEPCRYQFGPVVDNHVTIPSGGAAGCAPGFLFGRMPNEEKAHQVERPDKHLIQDYNQYKGDHGNYQIFRQQSRQSPGPGKASRHS